MRKEVLFNVTEFANWYDSYCLSKHTEGECVRCIHYARAAWQEAIDITRKDYENRKCEACKHKHSRSVRMDGIEYTCDKMIRIGGIGFDNNFCCKYWEGK